MEKGRLRFLILVLPGMLALSWLPVASQMACPPCDDANLCTTDSCDTTTGTCRYEAVSCDDGNPCTADSCSNFSSNNSCNKTGCCNAPLTSLACNDGNSCTSGDVCSSGVCRGSVLAEGSPCDDRDSCTNLDTCNASGSCVGAALPAGSPCDDQTACTTGDACAVDGAGGILCSGAPVSCSDGNPCTQDVCNPATGACSNPPVDCDDGNQCTADSLLCSGGLVCQHTPQNGSCQDAYPCSTADYCSNGVCIGAGTCDDNTFCTIDVCVQAQGCFHSPDNSLCADDNPCTFNERCFSGQGCTSQIHGFGAPCTPPTNSLCYSGHCSMNGQCAPDTPHCYDFDPCTQDLCDPGTGACSFPVDPTAQTPHLTIDSVTPNILSPANHKMMEITVTLTARTCDGTLLVPILSAIQSNQPDDAAGPGDGHTTQDIQEADLGTSDTQFLLRAERDKDLGQRIYTITYSATANGRTTYALAEVHVAGPGHRTAQTLPKPRQKPVPKD